MVLHSSASNQAFYSIFCKYHDTLHQFFQALLVVHLAGSQAGASPLHAGQPLSQAMLVESLQYVSRQNHVDFMRQDTDKLASNDQNLV